MIQEHKKGTGAGKKYFLCKTAQKRTGAAKKGVLCSCAPGDEVEPLLVPSLPAGGTIYLFQFNHLRFNSSATPTRTALLYKSHPNQTKSASRRRSVSTLPKSPGFQQSSSELIIVKRLTTLQSLSHKFTLEHAICENSS